MRRLVIGSATFALVSAMAVLAPTGASASPSHSSDRTAPSQGATAAKPAPPGGIAAAAASADRLVHSKPEVLKASKHDAFKAGKVLSSMGLNYVPYERTYRGIPVVGGDFVVSTDDNGKILATSVAQTRQVKLRSVKATVSKAAARATRQAAASRPRLGKTRLVVLQTKHSRLAWETWVTGRKHGEASRLTVYVDARTGRVLTTKEHVLDGTGTGNWEGTVTIPTTGSGSSFSMTNSNATTLKCQNSSGNATFTGTDDVWGNGSGTDRETGCVDAFYSAEKMRQMMSPWLGRNGMNGSGGWVPIRVGLNDVNAYYDGTQVQIGHNQGSNQWIGSIGRGRARVRPRRRRPDAGRHLAAAAPRSSWATPSARRPSTSPTTRPTPPDFLVGEEINLVGQGPIRNMYNPSAVGDPNCYSSSIPGTEVHAAAGPGNHWFYLLSQGSNPAGGPASPTCNGSTVTGIGIQKAQQDHVQRDADEDDLVVVPEVPHLDADRGQEPVPGQLHRVQHRQGGVGRGLASRPRRPTRPARPPAA